MLEINREVLEDQLDNLSLPQVLATLEALDKKKREYQELIKMPSYKVPKKVLKEKVVFFAGMVNAVEDYLATTFSVAEVTCIEQ